MKPPIDTKPMKYLLQLEEAALFGLSLLLYSSLPYPWWLFPLLLLVPDLSMAGYFFNPKGGAVMYNLFHHRALPVALYGAGTILGYPLLALIGIIMFAHSTMDRVFNYGLKHYKGFKSTHLGDM